MRDDHHPIIEEERITYFEKKEIIVEDFAASGMILDIGGGGEGVIGTLKGKQVVAIDQSRPVGPSYELGPRRSRPHPALPQRRLDCS